MTHTPHIGKGGKQPGDFGYEFDCDYEDCTFVFHPLDCRDPLPGVLEIRPPEGKVAHLQIYRRIDNAVTCHDKLLAALEGCLEALQSGMTDEERDRVFGDGYGIYQLMEEAEAAIQMAHP